MRVLEEINARVRVSERSDQSLHGDPLCCGNEPSAVGYCSPEGQRGGKMDGEAGRQR